MGGFQKCFGGRMNMVWAMSERELSSMALSFYHESLECLRSLRATC